MGETDARNENEAAGSARQADDDARGLRGRRRRGARLERHALLAGGGTGGHVFPALAVAEELLARGWRVSYAGSPSGLEARLVPERGIAFHGLPARPLLGRGPLAQALALATLARSAVAAAALIRRVGATVVLGTGGYVSAPAVVGGRLAGRPVLLLEPNARAGTANRWLSRCATEAAVGYAETARGLRCPATVTGVPVRAAFFAVPEMPEMPEIDESAGSAHSGGSGAFGEPAAAGGAAAPSGAGAAPRLLVLGGSQGARQLNRALPAAAALLLAALPELRIVHQAGARHVDETRAAYASAGAAGAAGAAAEQVTVVPFLADVAAAMAASHLLVSRAGAITVAEICAAGRAALLAPLAIAAGHQQDNARLLAAAGGALVLTVADLEPGPLAARLHALLTDGERLAAMGRAARALARPDAAAAIAGRLEALAGGRA
ncbi:MAG TPA: undecaprenyldiphospho-muramoylpentapeptide beta-N-acetylglucosaminyltransferase [Thermoanaerobaculia bacterium]|jgi:UDP-N-acetylglucosamine--N-acetylmuramyl-(pentapeptide) pyrophosphoryl-undecaprenol N-acetylglucosamine transferase|nr:undecaprenyldiphospho-muramoylpentapeptide beta-N-acetylglucosaminyltransferase [Thermoanaerobaculia bacterium]